MFTKKNARNLTSLRLTLYPNKVAVHPCTYPLKRFATSSDINCFFLLGTVMVSYLFLS